MRASSTLLVVLADYDFDGLRHQEEGAGLIVVPYIAWKYIQTLQHWPNHLKSVYNLVIYVEPPPIQRLLFARGKFRMAFIKELRPILVGRFTWPFIWISLTGNAKGY